MLWNVEQYSPAGARGWIVANDPNESAELLLFIYPEEWRTIVCDRMRADVMASGAHATGRCGFVIEPAVMARAFAAKASALCEKKSRMMLHRHVVGHDFVAGRVLLLTWSGLVSQLAIRLGKLYRLSYPHAEAMDQPTRHSFLALPHQTSLLLAGALAGEEIDRALDAPDFTCITLLAHPEKLAAARLARLCEAALDETRGAAFRATSPFARLIDDLLGVDPADAAALEAWTTRLTPEERLWLSDTMTRQIAGAQADEPVAERHLVAALKRLARFDAVGIEDDAQAFDRLIGAVLGPAAASSGPAPAPVATRARQLADALALGPLAAMDRKLYDLVRLGESARAPAAEQIAAIIDRN